MVLHSPYSALGYSGQPFGETTAITTEAQAAERAEQAVRHFLLPDSLPPVVSRLPDGGWQVVFPQRIDDILVAVDRSLQVSLNRAGQVTAIQGRRRPLLAQSHYPLRSADEAWRLLRRGCGFGITAGLLPEAPHPKEPFTVRQVALMYLITHANTPREIMQPYYVFQNETGQAIYIPAVADPYVEWP